MRKKSETSFEEMYARVILNAHHEIAHYPIRQLKNFDILEASTMFKELVHCILFNPLKSKQFHEVGRTITMLHMKKLWLINLMQCVPNHIAKYVVHAAEPGP